MCSFRDGAAAGDYRRENAGGVIGGMCSFRDGDAAGDTRDSCCALVFPFSGSFQLSWTVFSVLLPFHKLDRKF